MIVPVEYAIALAVAGGTVATVVGLVREFSTSVVIYSILMILVGILGLLAPTHWFFKFIAVLGIIGAVIMILSLRMPPLAGLAGAILFASPAFFPFIIGGLIAVGSPYWILALILSFFALLVLKRIFEKALQYIATFRRAATF